MWFGPSVQGLGTEIAEAEPLDMPLRFSSSSSISRRNGNNLARYRKATRKVKTKDSDMTPRGLGLIL